MKKNWILIIIIINRINSGGLQRADKKLGAKKLAEREAEKKHQ
jgi:hypothetical protein